MNEVLFRKLERLKEEVLYLKTRKRAFLKDLQGAVLSIFFSNSFRRFITR